MDIDNDLGTVRGVLRLLAGAHAGWLTADTPIGVEDSFGRVKRIAGFRRHELLGVEMMILTLDELPPRDGADGAACADHA